MPSDKNETAAPIAAEINRDGDDKETVATARGGGSNHKIKGDNKQMISEEEKSECCTMCVGAAGCACCCGILHFFTDCCTDCDCCDND